MHIFFQETLDAVNPIFFNDIVFGSLWIVIGVAILHYRLYDIDLIVNRMLVYGALTALLALVYFGSVVLLQNLFRTLTGQES